jgi:hypothetical protein
MPSLHIRYSYISIYYVVYIELILIYVSAETCAQADRSALSGEPPGGIGETGTTAAPPALANALFAATGIRLRRLPIDREVLSGRKPA